MLQLLSLNRRMTKNMEIKKMFLVLVTFTVVNAEIKSYEGFKLYKVTPKTVDEVESLLKVQRSGITEFWDEGFDVNHNVKIMVSSFLEAEFLEILKKAKIEATLVIENVQRAINNQLVSRHGRKRGKGGGSSGGKGSGGSSGGKGSSSKGSSSGSKGGWTYSTGKGSGRRRYRRNSNMLFSFTWDRYYRLDAIYAWLDELAEAFPNIVKTVVMGQSVEGRGIKGIVLDYHPERTEKRMGIFEGGLHAREWISPATVTWIIKEFLISDDPEVVALATNFEWHFFPVVNPDGYSYTFTNHRMWKKNRSTANFTSCASLGINDDMSNGVDLNRNFDFMWNTVGASDDPCSNLFAGPYPASEPETQAIAQYVMNLNSQGQIIYYISFHSYTQLVIVPHSHLTSGQVLQVDNYANMFEIAARAADVLERRNGTKYTVGISAEVMYAMSGTSFDWAKNAANIPVAYLIALRDLGEFGFLSPAEQIIPNNLEIMDALLEMDRATRDLRYYERSEFSGVNSVSILMVELGMAGALLFGLMLLCIF